MKKLFLLTALCFSVVLMGCRPKDPAILKVFVRSSTNQLVNGAKVVIIGDQQSNPPTLDFVDTSYTNSSGFTTVDMDQYFNGFFNFCFELSLNNMIKESKNYRIGYGST